MAFDTPPPNKLSETHGAIAGAPVTPTNQAGFDRLVQKALGDLETAKMKLEKVALLHHLRVFHIDSCNKFQSELKANPNRETLENAARQVLSMETIFMMDAIATVDMVTGLPNRRDVTAKIAIAIADLKREELGSAAIAFIDLNKFKPINDELGHDEGDKALKEVGKAIREHVRANDVVARIGGDEFVVLLRHKEKDHDFLQDIKHLQDMFRQGIPYKHTASGKIYPVGAEIGFEIIKRSDLADTALNAADQKMNVLKKGSRGLASDQEPSMPSDTEPS